MAQIQRMARAGLSPVKVRGKMKGSPLKISERSIYRWCNEVSEENEHINDRPDGRPRTATEDEDARFVEKVTSEPLKPVTEHKKELEEEGISTSERIMRSRLNEAGSNCSSLMVMLAFGGRKVLPGMLSILCQLWNIVVGEFLSGVLLGKVELESSTKSRALWTKSTTSTRSFINRSSLHSKFDVLGDDCLWWHSCCTLFYIFCAVLMN